MTGKRRVVYDCNTLLQGLASPKGAAGACVQLVLDGKAELFFSAAGIAELRDVAMRPRVMRKLQLAQERIEDFIGTIESAGILVGTVSELFVYERDPDDAHYVNLALAAKAELIVSRDLDLLDLMDMSRAEGREFRRRFPNLKILTPPAFLAEVGVE